MRKWLPFVRRPGARGWGGGKSGRVAAAGVGRARSSNVTADLVALRARIAAISARPRDGFSHPSAAGGGQGGGPGPRHEPPACQEEATPFGPVMARREWLADERACEVAALATCLGFAPDDLQRPLFLETETTGLSGGTGTVAFLIGVARPESGGLPLVQYFA